MRSGAGSRVGTGGIRATDAFLSAATVGIILSPFMTVDLSPKAALFVQALSVTSIVGALIAAGWFRRAPLRWFRTAPNAVVGGLALYTTVAFAAALSGLLQGNKPMLVAGQLLSMALLPLGAVAASGVFSARTPRVLAVTVVLVVCLATLVHVGVFVYRLAMRDLTYRLYLGNNVSVMAYALLSLLLCLALAVVSDGIPGVLLRVAILVLLVLVLGSGARSLWLVTPPAIGVYLILSGTARHLLRPNALLLIAVVAATLLAVAAGVSFVVAEPRPSVLPDTSFTQSFWCTPDFTSLQTQEAARGEAHALRWDPPDNAPRAVTRAFAVSPGRAYRLRTSVRTESPGAARILIVWENAAHEARGYLMIIAWPEDGWQELAMAGVSPPDAAWAHIEVSLRRPGTGAWLLRSISLEELGSPLMAALDHQYRYWRKRLVSLTEPNRPESPNAQSMAGRFRETRALLERFRAATLPHKVLGHGLGATFVSDPSRPTELNYIHNFFVFLLFKTGIVGFIAICAALGMWMTHTYRSARRASDPWSRAFLWAAFSAWLSTFSP